MTLSLEDLIEKRHNDAGWIVIRELGNATGYHTKRHADAVALGIWPSRGYEIHGYECKRSRGDVQKELDDPSKADAVGAYCDYWWLVVSDLKIIDGLMVPETWGVLYPKAQVLRVHRKAPKRIKAKQVDRAFAASVIRRVCSEWVPKWNLAELEKKTIEDATKRVENETKWKIENAVRDNEHMKATIAAFEKWSGVSLGGGNLLSNWQLEQIGEAVKIVVEARSVSGARHRSAYDAPEQLVAGEIARLDRTIADQDRVKTALESARSRLQILQATFVDPQPTLPEFPE